jgi:galactose-1-phosphate uridylyltransferase
MPLEYRIDGGRLVWVRNPFSGTVTYFTDVHLKRNGFPSRFGAAGGGTPRILGDSADHERRQREEFRRNCPFCPGNEWRAADEVARRNPQQIFGCGASDQWLIRAVRNLVPRIPDCCTGGKNESYVVVEDPRHFREDHRRYDYLCSADLPEEQFLGVLDVCREVAALAYENPSVRHVLIRKNQGPQSGASQPHIHSQVIGSDRIFPFVERERGITAREPALWREIVAFARAQRFVLREDGDLVLYFCPFGTFPRSYEVVALESWDRLTEVRRDEWRRFGSFLHHGLKLLGARSLDYEIHDGPGVPLHAHIHSRHYPYAEIGGTLNLPAAARLVAELTNPPLDVA